MARCVFDLSPVARQCRSLPPVTMECVTTAIVVTVLVLLGLGIVINELLRLRTWLKNSPAPPSAGDDESPDEET